MKQERNAERDERQSRQQVERIAVAKRREDINAISQRLAALLEWMTNHRKGKASRRDS